MKSIRKRTLTVLTATVLLLLIASCGAKPEEPVDGTPDAPAQVTEPTQEPEKPAEPEPEEPEPAGEPEEPEPDTVPFDLDGDGTPDYSVDFGKRELIRSDPGKNAESYSDEKTGLVIEFRLAGTGKAVELAPSYVNSYLDYTAIEYQDVKTVCGSAYKGETITAENADTKLCAWLIDTKSGVFSIVFTYPAESTEAYDEAYAALSKLQLSYETIASDRIIMG